MNYLEFKTKYQIQLNTQQEKALRSVKGEILLLAVPGSGKTTVLISRLGYMIFCENINPESILTVTYTKNATKEMKERFADKFGSEYAERLEFKTINSISDKILKYFFKITGKNAFTINKKESKNIIKKVFRAVTGQYATENDIINVEKGIAYVKNMKLSDVEIQKLDVGIDDFYKIYTMYNKVHRAQSLMDHDDQIVYALRILKQSSQVLNYFQNKYQYFCVDEAQDTSKIQHELMNLLASKSRNLFMVGDEDQSIYGFRAAYPEALVRFEDEHPEAKVLLMELNYRSGQKIVAAADKLIQLNKSRHEKNMKAFRNMEGMVTQIAMESRQSQYSYLMKVAEECSEETAVLYRNHESALPLIDLLDRRKIMYRLKESEMTFFSHPIVNDICDFIKLAINPEDKEAFGNIYYKMGAGITKAVASATIEKKNREGSFLDVIANNRENSDFMRKKCKALAIQFSNMREENAGKAVYRILHFMGYREYMETHKMDSSKADILQIIGNQEESLAGFLRRLEQLQKIVQSGTENSQGKIILSTIHSSKGLEYDRVYMLDMVQGILPSSKELKINNAEPKEIAVYEEERRLYYVGMTRAKNKLHIFTFSDTQTSDFSKTVFDIKKSVEVHPVQKKTTMKLAANPYTSKKNNSLVAKVFLEEYVKGLIVQHKKYGRGVVVERKGSIAEILFDDESTPRKISLEIAVANGLIKIF